MSRIYRMRNAVYWCSGGLLCLNLLPHVIPSLPSRSMSWAGRDPPHELTDHVCKIARVMGLPHAQKTKVFITKGLTSMAFGSPWLPNGMAIGLPRTILFRNSEDLKASLLESAGRYGQPIDWDSDMGISLTSSLIHSPQQINFLIAHEVAHLKHHDWLPRAVLPSVTLVIAYHVARVISYAAPGQSVARFALVMAASLAVYLQLMASLSHRQEFRADKMAALCSSNYAQGGLDHFTKRMKLDLLLESMTKRSPLDRLQPTFSLHPPAQVRYERIQSVISSSANRPS